MAERPVLVAAVDGNAAIVIGSILDRVLPAELPQVAQRHGDGIAADVRRAWVAITAAANAQRAWLNASTVSANGSVVDGVAEAAAPLAREIPANVAAARIGRSPRRVGQLVVEEKLVGRKVGGRLFVDLASVESYLAG